MMKTMLKKCCYKFKEEKNTTQSSHNQIEWVWIGMRERNKRGINPNQWMSNKFMEMGTIKKWDENQ